MRHCASAIIVRSVIIATCLVVVPSAACAPTQDSQAQRATPEAPERLVQLTIDDIPAETAVRIVVTRDEAGIPTALDVEPRSAVVCTNPTKHCAGAVRWTIEDALRIGDAVRLSVVSDTDTRLPMPVEALHVPEVVVEGGRETPIPLFTIPEDYRAIEPEPGQEIVNVFYAVEITWGTGNSIVFDPRVIIDRTR
jgi:hypothetical protein